MAINMKKLTLRKRSLSKIGANTQLAINANCSKMSIHHDTRKWMCILFLVVLRPKQEQRRKR